MKKLLLLTLSVLLILNACKKGDDDKPKNEEVALSTSVVSVKAAKLASDGIRDSNAYAGYLYSYDKGMLMEVKSDFLYNGEPYEAFSYKYMSDKIIRTEKGGWSLQSKSFNMELDEQGRLIKEDLGNDDDRLYTYQSNGYLKNIEERHKTDQGEKYKNMSYFTFIDGNLSTVERKSSSSSDSHYIARFTYSDESIQIPQILRSLLLENIRYNYFDFVFEPFVGKTLFTKAPQSLETTFTYPDGSKSIWRTRFFYDKKDSKGRIIEFRTVDEYLSKPNGGERYTVTYND